jgi:hypothetical protein
MKALQPVGSLHLQAAQGWCELRAFAEADAELDHIAASLRAHPKVLEVRWQIYTNLEKWTGALDTTSAIVKGVPDWPSCRAAISVAEKECCSIRRHCQEPPDADALVRCCGRRQGNPPADPIKPSEASFPARSVHLR